VAAPSIADVTSRLAPFGACCLGHVLLALRLKGDSSWQGEIRLETDAFGRIEFPGSDWLIVLSRPRDGPRGVLAGQKIGINIGPRRVCWHLFGKQRGPFLEMSRDDLLRMLVDNEEQLEADRFLFSTRDVRAALIRKTCIPGSAVRYDPVSFADFAGHAPLVGGLVAAVIAAMRSCSSLVANEFEALIRSVRGFEVRTLAAGTIQSFSDPSIPGVMNINVPFTERDEPRLCPLCFTWFGHELGHTKSYLIETIAHVAGQDLLKNPQQSTKLLPRYGRALRLRTLLQIPYTHLYEWQLLADFLEHRFAGLPWAVDGDAGAAGHDLSSEIQES
jgi:hypothetical protein